MRYLSTDRAHGREFSRQFEESCQKLDDYVHHLEVEIKDRADLTEMLEDSEIYYDAQYGEAKIVTNVSSVSFGETHISVKSATRDVNSQERLPSVVSIYKSGFARALKSLRSA